jgi:16S rRNA (adenine(1408)-N(1))-methyltransferase
MADSSRRAASSVRHGGVPNALFLAAALEELPGQLAGRVHRVTVALPWGSLLRGLTNVDAGVINAITGVLSDNGELELLVSATDVDARQTSVMLESEPDAAALASALESAGLHVLECRPALESDVQRLSSGWGRRLGIPGRRRAWLFRARQATGSRPL